jgi:hypothetical protein
MKPAAIAFGSASVILAAIAMLLWPRFTTHPMIAFPQMTLLLSAVPIIFYFISQAPKPRSGQIAGIASCAIWVMGIGLAFLVPPGSPYIYVPDMLLMLGFYPLLFFWRFSWTWIIFGILNFGIGILLMVIQYSPDNLFPPELLKPKHHLADYHPAVIWTTTGIVAFAFGIGRLAKNLYLMIRKKREAKAQ